MLNPRLTRRSFVGATGAALAAAALPRSAARLRFPAPPDCVAIASDNGLRAVERARALVLQENLRPVSAAVQGVAIVEADPNDMSVGYGGLPNEDGVVQLDAACMDGPHHNAGGVACIEGIMHPAQVAERVMDLSGLLAGSMTDPPALAFASNIAKSDAPTIAYATVYPLTTLLRILAAQILAIVLFR